MPLVTAGRKPYPFDKGRMDTRLRALDAARSTATYAKQYLATVGRFCDFLAARHGPPRCISMATPTDVVEYAITREPSCRTIFHGESCIFRGYPSAEVHCKCPFGMPPASFETLKGHLSSYFIRHNRGGEWQADLFTGNPCASQRVRDHRADLAREAAAAAVAPQQAVVFFSDKLIRVVVHILGKITGWTGPTLRKLMWWSDVAVLLAIFSAGKRGADMAHLPVNGCYFAPNGSGVFFRTNWSKTVRGSTDWTFAPACPTRPHLCVVWAMRKYLTCAAALGYPRTGKLFADHVMPDGLAAAAFDAAAFNRRVQGYLEEVGIFAGESVHGLRAGAPIERAIATGDAAAALDTGTWKTAAVAERYCELVDVMVTCYRGDDRKPHGWETHTQRIQDFRALNDQHALDSAVVLLGGQAGRISNIRCAD